MIATLTDEQKAAVRDYFQADAAGTANTNEDDMEHALRGMGIELSSDDRLFCELLDEMIFRCEVCGWWCDRDEESEKEMVCDECAA